MAKEVEPPERPDLYVVARFLDALHNDDGVHTNSSLQMAVGLNYDRYLAYLAFLEAKGWVRVDESVAGSPEVRLTREGVGAYEHLVQWIRDTIGEDRL